MNNNKYLLGALGVLILVAIGAFVLINRGNSGSEREPIAAVTESEPIDEPNDVTELPPLPILADNQGIGGGGGSGETSARPATDSAALSVESPALGFDESSFIYTDPFSGTTFILNSPLPSAPRVASVLQNVPMETVTVEQAAELAARFGFSGLLYREQYPVFEQEIDAPAFYEPPVTYHAFDGSRSLAIDLWGTYYNDNSIINGYENPLPFEQAAPIAEAFLNERGLLDFEYEVRQIWGTDANFVRKIDGYLVDQPEITVGVSQDGRIFFVSYQVLRNSEILGRYPIISAEAAWELLQSGVAENNIPYSYSVGPEFAISEPGVPFEEPFTDQYQFWMRDYAPGDEIHLYEWPVVYLPVDSDANPRIQVGDYLLQADSAMLNALAEQAGQQVHIWGQVGADGSTIAVVGWETVNQDSSAVSGTGTISRQGDQVLFRNAENGRTYIIPDAPADLEDGLEVYLFAWAARDLGQEYLLLDWENIERIVDYPEEFIEEPVGEPVIGELPITGDDGEFAPFTYESFTVNEVVLAYYTSYSWPNNGGDESSEFFYEGQPTVIIQPTWKFSGETNSGDFVEFFVQAAEGQFLNR